MGSYPAARTRPKGLRQVDAAHLGIAWADGHDSVYPVRYLRAHCTCAGCVDELTGDRLVEEADLPPDVRPVRIEPVGHYALSIEWSDGHATGIYTFERLRELCPCEQCRQQE